MMYLDKIKAVADLLSLFVNKEGLKLLTHDLNEVEVKDFLLYLSHGRSLLLDYKDRIPEHLYKLMLGFMSGPSWTDSKGAEHTFFCSSPECVKWCSENKGKHPLCDNDYSPEEFQRERAAFQHSIRVISPDLEDFVLSIKPNAIPERLSGAQFYTDTNRLYTVIKKIFDMMTDPRYDDYQDIKVTFIRGEKDSEGYRVSKLLIEQVGSFSPAPINDVYAKINAGGGDLGALKSLMEGYYLWSIETKWDNVPARLNILSADEFDNPRERIIESDATGFRHIITIYHKAM